MVWTVYGRALSSPFYPGRISKEERNAVSRVGNLSPRPSCQPLRPRSWISPRSSAPNFPHAWFTLYPSSPSPFFPPVSGAELDSRATWWLSSFYFRSRTPARYANNRHCCPPRRWYVASWEILDIRNRFYLIDPGILTWWILLQKNDGLEEEKNIIITHMRDSLHNPHRGQTKALYQHAPSDQRRLLIIKISEIKDSSDPWDNYLSDVSNPFYFCSESPHLML